MKKNVLENKFVDKAIYRKNGSLRLWGSYKKDQEHPLRKYKSNKIPTYEEFCKSIIGLYHKPEEVRVTKKKKLPKAVKFGQIKKGNVKEIEKYITKDLHPVLGVTQKKQNYYHVLRYIYIYI